MAKQGGYTSSGCLHWCQKGWYLSPKESGLRFSGGMQLAFLPPFRVDSTYTVMFSCNEIPVSTVPRLLLYKQTASPPSCAVMMLADILGLKLEYKEPSLLKLEHKTNEFKKINPMGTIPVLQDDDFVVSESHAIMMYLLSKYGGEHKERLYPSDAQTRAKIDTCMFFDAGVLFNRLKVVALPTLLQGFSGALPQQLSDIDEAYSVLEAYLETSKYIAANHITIADLSLGATTTAMQAIHKLDENKFPRSAEWLSLINSESYFKKINEPGVALLTNVLNTFWTKNKNKD